MTCQLALSLHEHGALAWSRDARALRGVLVVLGLEARRAIERLAVVGPAFFPMADGRQNVHGAGKARWWVAIVVAGAVLGPTVLDIARPAAEAFGWVPRGGGRGERPSQDPPLARVVALGVAAVVVLVLGSFPAGRGARRAGSFANTAAFPRGGSHGAQLALVERAARARVRRARRLGGRGAPGRGGSESCDFAPAIELSLAGRVVRSVPSDLARRLADERTRHHGVLYVLLVPGERVRAALSRRS